MSNKKFKVHCRIIDYLSSADPEIADLIKGTCADMSLSSLRNKPGVTFLNPIDKNYRKKISDLAYSSKVEDVNKASDMINALIIRDVFKNANDWIAKKDDIPNSLVIPQLVEVSKTAGNDIIFKSGAKATLDADFIDASRKSQLAVWKLTEGEIPVTTDKPAKLKYATHKRPTTGGYDVASTVTQPERFKISIAIENAYVLHQLQDKTIKNKVYRDIYLEYSFSLLHYLMYIRKDNATLLDKVLPMIALDKMDLYFLLEPHNTTGNYLLNNDIIHDWWESQSTYKPSPQKIIDDFSALLSSSSSNSAAIYHDREAILAEINAERNKLISQVESRPRSSVDSIAAVYDNLSSSNTIGTISNIYPPGVANLYKSEPGLKMLQDELRYLTYGAFRRLEASSTFDINRYNELVNMIGECLLSQTADQRNRSQKLLNKNSIKYLISPTEKLEEIKMFVASTMFLHIPLTRAECENMKQKNSEHRPDPDNIVVFNIQRDLYNRHARLIADPESSQKVTDLIAALKSLDLGKIDPDLAAEIRAKFS